MEASKKLAQENGNQASVLLGELTGDELLAQNGNQAGSAMGELTDDELLAQNGNQAGVGVAEHYDELAGGSKCLTFTANEDGVELAFFFDHGAAGEQQENPDITFQKSRDGGVTWEAYTIGDYYPKGGDISELDVITLDEGESVMFKGVNLENFTVGDPIGTGGISVGFYLTGSAAASGDITSLINGAGGDADIQFMQFYRMFYGCTGLTQAPALPATELADYCYYYMFYGCTGLTQAPALPATTLASGCYDSMFYGCTGLTQAPALPATTLAEYCYSSMFNGCTGLTQAPVLPATALASNCYTSMFDTCSSIQSHDVATLNYSTQIFYGNSSCVSLTIHADTPPMISNNTLLGLKADCIIYVPAASVDAYKAAQYWSARASYIQAIQGAIQEVVK